MLYWQRTCSKPKSDDKIVVDKSNNRGKLRHYNYIALLGLNDSLTKIYVKYLHFLYIISTLYCTVAHPENILRPNPLIELQ